jgi:hypothetical protein
LTADTIFFSDFGVTDFGLPDFYRFYGATFPILVSSSILHCVVREIPVFTVTYRLVAPYNRNPIAIPF